MPGQGASVARLELGVLEPVDVGQRAAGGRAPARRRRRPWSAGRSRTCCPAAAARSRGDTPATAGSPASRASRRPSAGPGSPGWSCRSWPSPRPRSRSRRGCCCDLRNAHPLADRPLDLLAGDAARRRRPARATSTDEGRQDRSGTRASASGTWAVPSECRAGGVRRCPRSAPLPMIVTSPEAFGKRSSPHGDARRAPRSAYSGTSARSSSS